MAAADEHGNHHENSGNHRDSLPKNLVYDTQDSGHQAPASQPFQSLASLMHVHILQILIIHRHALSVQRLALYLLHIFQFSIKEHDQDAFCGLHQEGARHTDGHIAQQQSGIHSRINRIHQHTRENHCNKGPHCRKYGQPHHTDQHIFVLFRETAQQNKYIFPILSTHQTHPFPASWSHRRHPSGGFCVSAHLLPYNIGSAPQKAGHSVYFRPAGSHGCPPL